MKKQKQKTKRKAKEKITSLFGLTGATKNIWYTKRKEKRLVILLSKC